MALPPLDAGAVQVKLTWVLPGVPVSAVGAPGTASGVMPVVAADSVPLPTALPVAPPGEAVTRYPVTALPPSEAGAVQVKPTWPLPGVPMSAVGAPGRVRGTMPVVDADSGLLPSMLVAWTVNV